MTHDPLQTSHEHTGLLGLSWPLFCAELRVKSWSEVHPLVCAAASFYGHVEHGAEHQSAHSFTPAFMSYNTRYGLVDLFSSCVWSSVRAIALMHFLNAWTKSVI